MESRGFVFGPSDPARVDEQRYLINGKVYAPHDPGLQEALARVYGTPARPRCLCIDGGVEMYVSRFDEFVVKRMPDTGGRHALTCPSFDLPENESARDTRLGDAILERRPDLVELRLDFPLTRRPGHGHATVMVSEPANIHSLRAQLSLRGLLLYLWERAGLNRWYPAMRGKRSYAVVRKFVLQACDEIDTKGLRLSTRVFMPEPFVAERAAEIADRNLRALMPLVRRASSQRNLMIAIGELKLLASARIGQRLVLKRPSPFELITRARRA